MSRHSDYAVYRIFFTIVLPTMYDAPINEDISRVKSYLSSLDAEGHATRNHGDVVDRVARMHWCFVTRMEAHDNEGACSGLHQLKARRYIW